MPSTGFRKHYPPSGTTSRSAPSLVSLAGQRLQQREAEQRLLKPLQPKPSALEYIPLASPQYQQPRHLSRLTDVFTDIVVNKNPRFVIVAAPPRFAKTETCWHDINWALEYHVPEWTFGYASYTMRLARSVARKTRNKFVERGGLLGAVAQADEWRTPEGGGVIAGGIRGAFTGFGINVAIVDDPVKSRAEAESPVMREATIEWFDGTWFQRIEPGGSCIVFATRWHEDDLSGYLIKQGWEYINLQAITGEGDEEVSLWPERWSVEELRKKRKRAGEYNWWSVYQGQPRPRGGKLFDPSKLGTYRELPRQWRAIAFGVDLAYSTKTSSDYSVLVKMGLAYDGKKYLLGVWRRQVKVKAFKKLCRIQWRKSKTARLRWYGSTTESGTADLFTEEPRPVPLEYESANEAGDKFTRAQPFAAQWADGMILVPEDPSAFGFEEESLDDWIGEHSDFTGKEGGTDDQVDATVACSDLLDDMAGTDDDVDEDVKDAPRHGTGALPM